MTKTRTRRLLAVTLSAVLSAAFVEAAARADQGEGSPIAPVTAAAEARIAVGGLHACAVLADRTAQCWGNNDQGQLGNDSIVTSTDPVPVKNLSNATAVTAGNTHTCALIDDGRGNGTGTVKCWGLAANGQVGDGTVGDKQSDPAKAPTRRTPQTVLTAPNTPLSGVVAVVAGGFHTCAVTKDATSGATAVWCWGDDGSGQLGDGKPGDRSLFAQLVPGVSNVRSLALGEFHTCALLYDGTVQCWGANSFGQLTLDPAMTKSSAAPVTVRGLPAPSTDDPQVLAITTGYGHVCVLLKDNTASCWGANNFGQLGYKTPYEKPSGAPYQVIEPMRTMLPSTAPKTVQHNNHTPDRADQTTEDLVPQGGIIALSAGQFHTCALISDGSARCWGEGGRGQLGTDPYPPSRNEATLEDSVYTVAVQNLSAPAVAITAGGFETCAANSSGLQCWGYNFYGQLGSSAPFSKVPVQVTAVTGASKVAAGTGFACALVNADTTNKPVCWGDNTDGRLGAGLTVARSSIRTPVAGISSASTLDLGNGQACAIPSGATVPLCWGSNSNGQVGDGTTTARPTPVAVSGLATASGLEAGGARDAAERGHTCALTSNNKVSCWGRNGNGELGVEENDGSLADHSTPVVVQYDSNPARPDTDPRNVTLADLDSVTSVVTGGFHSCALRSDGTVWCWGRNDVGQLGDGSTTEWHHAVQVQKDDADLANNHPLTGVRALTVGADFTCALLATGSAKCWGGNGHGQLGDGTKTARLVPAQVSGLDGAVPPGQASTLSAGDQHVCAVRGDQALVCWGQGSSGQLGYGGTDDQTTPAQVASMGPPPSGVPSPYVLSLSASRQDTCAVLIDTTVYCWGDNSRDQLGDGIGATSVSPKDVGLVGAF